MQNKIITALSIIIFIIPVFGFFTLPGFEGMRNEIFGSNTQQYERQTQRVFSTSAYHLVFAPVEQDMPEKPAKPTEESIVTAVYISDKIPAQYIRVDAVTLAAPGFVVLFEKNAEPTGEIASASKYLEKGVHTGVIINLGHVPEVGDVFDAVLVEDNGDEEFDLVEDGLVRDAEGNAVFDELVFIAAIEE